METKRIGVLAAIVALTVGPATAHAKPPPEMPADQPIVGDVNGVYGPGPEVAVNGGREWLFGGGRVWIEVWCDTSTDLGCAGDLAVTDGSGVTLDVSSFELPEDHGASVGIDLPQRAVRLARRSGLKLIASASATDSLGREASDSATITVVRPKR